MRRRRQHIIKLLNVNIVVCLFWSVEKEFDTRVQTIEEVGLECTEICQQTRNLPTNERNRGCNDAMPK